MKHKYMYLSLLPLSAAILMADLTALKADDHMKDLIAVTVRRHGFKCATPQSAERNKEKSTPGQAAWRFNCSNGSYFVKFTGSGRALVKSLKEDKNKKATE